MAASQSVQNQKIDKNENAQIQFKSILSVSVSALVLRNGEKARRKGV